MNSTMHHDSGGGGTHQNLGEEGHAYEIEEALLFYSNIRNSANFCRVSKVTIVSNQITMSKKQAAAASNTVEECSALASQVGSDAFTLCLGGGPAAVSELRSAGVDLQSAIGAVILKGNAIREAKIVAQKAASGLGKK